MRYIKSNISKAFKKAYSILELSIAFTIVTAVCLYAAEGNSSLISARKQTEARVLSEAYIIDITERMQKELNNEGILDMHYETTDDLQNTRVFIDVDTELVPNKNNIPSYLVTTTIKLGGGATQKTTSKVVLVRQEDVLREEEE